MPRDDGMESVRLAARPALPRRFFREAGFGPGDGGFALRLDGRPARTPGRSPLVAPTIRLAEAMAAEWNAQGETIDPAAMPLTRLLNSAIDGVAGRRAEVTSEIVRYAGSDLVCYRAGGPRGLVERQEAAWSPLVAWVGQALGVRLRLAEGVMPVAQDEAALAAVAAAIGRLDSYRLAAVLLATTLTGSAVIALALARGAIGPDLAWAAAHVDEDWEIGLWGEDAEAAARRAARRRDFDAAALVLAAD